MTTITEQTSKTWDDLVAEGIEVMHTIDNRQWRLGDLAITVAGPAHGTEDKEGRGGKLAKYAEEIGVDYMQLAQYRVVATAWKFYARKTSVPWTLYRELSRNDDRETRLAAFIADCEDQQIKPSYRALQAFLGKRPTPQYTARDREEQVRRGLADMEPDERDEVLRDFLPPDLDDLDNIGEISEDEPDGTGGPNGAGIHRPRPAPPAPKNPAHVTRNARWPEDAEHEWYTPEEYIDAAVAAMGGIDLDPASTLRANDVVRAAAIWTREDDGLAQPWGGRVWMNPPYERGLVDKFCRKLAEEFASGRVTEAIVLVNNSTDSSWWQELTGHVTAACFPLYRVRFWHPEGKPSNPLQGHTLLYLGSNPARFCRAFAEFGRAWALTTVQDT